MPYSLKFFIIVFLLIIILVICITLISSTKSYKRKGLRRNEEVEQLTNHVTPSKLLSEYEIEMYELLTEACPKHIVLCQVSFNAFIKCAEIGVRNKFNRSMCDFMIVDHNFVPIVCVELDDRTHLGSNKKRDEFRDNLLSAAYIPTERFFGLPDDVNTVKNRLKYYLTQKSSLVHEKLMID